VIKIKLTDKEVAILTNALQNAAVELDDAAEAVEHGEPRLADAFRVDAALNRALSAKLENAEEV
jgi:hypothetical protein